MRLSMWSYPWDFEDIGVDEAIGELRDLASLNTVSPATSYHAGRFLQPRSPVRKAYFPEDGTIYFRPDPKLWEGAALAPQVASIVERRDILRELTQRRDAGGMAVSCWTVCLHNTRLGMRYPHTVTRNAFGDPNYYNLCPSHPDARAYVRALVADVSQNYRPDSIELESPCFMGFAHEFHHEKDGVGLTAEDDFLLSLCFCDACLIRARKAGVDGDRARATVRQWIAETCEREIPAPRWPQFPQTGLDVFKPHPEVYDYLMWRFEPVTSLIAELREAAAAATKVYLIDLKDGWIGGCDLAAIGKVCDGAILCAYNMAPAATEALMRDGRRALGPDKYLGAGLRVFYPEAPSAESLALRSQAARAGGANGINYYNYGLIPKKRLDWVGAAVQALGPGRAS
jgi:hypothetical protein